MPGGPSVVLAHHLDHIVAVAREGVDDELGGDLRVGLRVVAAALAARALVPAELEEAVTVGAVGLGIAGGLLHREAGHHDGRDAVRLGDRIEHGEVLLAWRKRGVARAEVVGEVDVGELAHGHVRCHQDRR